MNGGIKMGKLNKKIGFIGGGQMGAAIIGGLLNAGLFENSDICYGYSSTKIRLFKIYL